jgi:hypothetical protein
LLLLVSVLSCSVWLWSVTNVEPLAEAAGKSGDFFSDSF